MDDKQTMCWCCNAPYSNVLITCPECGSANANHDPEKAQAELQQIVAGARSC